MADPAVPAQLPPPPPDWPVLVAACRPVLHGALAESVLPFWSRAIDRGHGGVFTCWSNDGTRLLSRDKFTWSQGRFAWLWSRLAGLAAAGLVPGDPDDFLEPAARTVRFLTTHGRLADGRIAFRLSEDGVVQEAGPGLGLAPSIYADCFVVMGLAETARARREPRLLDQGWSIFEHVERRIASGDAPTHPVPTPPGYRSHALAMIRLNVSLVLRAACEGLGDARSGLAHEAVLAAAAGLMEDFFAPGGRIVELLPLDPADGGTLLGRHVNPGHSLEGLWMLLMVAAREGRGDWLARVGEAIRYAFAVGWDRAHGGVLYFVDCDDGPPRGRAGTSAYEAAVRAGWDKKLWWVHSEALFASLLGYRLTGDGELRTWFDQVFEYVFRVFPHPNPAVGEWIQIRDRRGVPVESVVALPVKDPYHIARNLLQCLELVSLPEPPLAP